MAALPSSLQGRMAFPRRAVEIIDGSPIVSIANKAAWQSQL
ncbi:hypothetical protein [Mesorhizobium sp. M1428]